MARPSSSSSSSARTVSRALLAVVALTSLSAAEGCAALRRLAGNDTINLEKAEVKTMSVDIRRQQKTICPRDNVQMAIFADVVLDGDKAPKPVETWQGKKGVNKNDKLDFVDFAFQSDQGAFDRDGWFAPNPDLLATVGKEFSIKSVYRRRPDKFSFTTTYKPDYSCIKEGGSGGGAGREGPAGGDGSSGKSGASGSSSSSGGEGGDGGSGTSGGSGADGTQGPKLTVYATVVKTAFYERLIAISIDGDQKDFLLVPEGQPITHQGARRRGRHRRTRRSWRLGWLGRLGQPWRSRRQGRSGRQRRQRRQRRPRRLHRIRV